MFVFLIKRKHVSICVLTNAVFALRASSAALLINFQYFPVTGSESKRDGTREKVGGRAKTFTSNYCATLDPRDAQHYAY